MPLMRGAKLSPRHKLAAAEPHKPVGAPPQYANVPAFLSMWGNDQYGDCVSAEEAFAKSAAAPNVKYSDHDVINFAGRHGWLDGADLAEVMDAMIQSGMACAADGQVYKDGPYKSVDWTNRATLCDALYQGPVKIAVAASQLQSAGAGNGNGWFGHGFRQDQNIDHCVALTGYGPLGFLFAALARPVPAGADASAFGYLLFTWNSIGVIDEPSLLAITAEAWLRNPTTAGFPTPTPPPPPVPPPPPPPVPPAPGWLVRFLQWLISVLGGGTPVRDVMGKVVTPEAMTVSHNHRLGLHGGATLDSLDWQSIIAWVRALLQQYGPVVIPQLYAWIDALPVGLFLKLALKALVRLLAAQL